MSIETLGKQRALLLILAATLLFAGCRQDMHDQPRFEPLEASSMFADFASSRIPPAHTVARGQLNADTAFHTGSDDAGDWVETFPMQVTPELLQRGAQRYDIHCTPCHDRTGGGNGMIVQRGFKQPPSYHEERLRESPIGYFFDVASNGYGQMSGYKAAIKTEDRWAIAAHIRVLQRAAFAPYDSLSSTERERVDNGDVHHADGHDGDEDHSEADAASDHDAGHGA
ncbi:MAG: cytochrome c [Acidobacteriota bacterium]